MSGRSQMAAMNGKRPSAIPARLQPEPVTQHDDLIKYIYKSWNTVLGELDMCHKQHNNSANDRNGASVTYYQEREPNPQLKGKLVGPASVAARSILQTDSNAPVQTSSPSTWKPGGANVSSRASLGTRPPSARPLAIIGPFLTGIRNRKDKKKISSSK